MDIKLAKVSLLLKNLFLVLLCGTMVSFLGNPLFAKSGRDIMKKVREQSRIHKTTESDVFMLVKDAKKRKRKRYFNNKKKINGDISNSLIKFFKPANVKGTGLLSLSNEKTSKNKQWLYLPSMRSMKRLGSNDKNKSFMGSDFTNDDIAGRVLDRDTHKLNKTKGDYHQITSIPKDKDEPYSKLVLSVHRKMNIVSKVVFYDKKGRKLKTLQNTKFKKVKGMYMVKKAIMSNHITKGVTSLKVSKIKVGHKISDNDAGVKGLRK